MRSHEEENTRLEQLVADRTLDKHTLAEALRKKPDADTATRLWPGGRRCSGSRWMTCSSIEKPRSVNRTRVHVGAITARRNGENP